MGAIYSEDIWMLGLVSILAVFRAGMYANKVGQARRKFKINPPLVDGPEEFQRIFRAQQNTLEFIPIFLVSLWVAGIFLHQAPAAFVGVLYIYAREKYFNGYSESAKGRVPGFYLSVKCLYGFLVLAVIGIGKTAFTALVL